MRGGSRKSPERTGKAERRRHERTNELAAEILSELAARRVGAGTHVSAQQVADDLGVSRSPVRAAFAALKKRGILVHARNRGYFLADMDLDAVEVFEPRREGRLHTIYLEIAEDRLAGRIPDRVSETHLRMRYALTERELATVLTRISQEGWAERSRGYGWTFSDVLLTPEALEQTYRLRMALEPNALREPGFRIERRDLAHRRRIEERLLAGEIDIVSPDELHDRGVRFHEELAAASGNPFFLEALKRINRVRRLLAYRSMQERSRYYTQAEEHLAIIAHIEEGRMEDAAGAMHTHLRHVAENLKKIRGLLESR